MLFRKESARVKTTIKRTFDAAISTLRLENGWTKLDREFRSDSGAEVFLAGLDSEDKAKGVEGVNYVLFDELNQFELNEYEQVVMSLRGKGRKIFFGTWNPVSKNHWLKTELVDSYSWLPTEYELPNPRSSVKISSCGTRVLIHTNYIDNYWTVGSPCGTYGFRDEALLKEYDNLKNNPTKQNTYRINVQGLWGNSNQGGEMYTGFSHYNNVINEKLATYNPLEPLHISFDENTKPYVSLSVYQAESNDWKSVKKIDEICLKHPFNKLKYTVEEFIKVYKGHNLYVYVYGDRTSLKDDSKLERGQNFFTIIEDKLRINGFKIKRRLPRVNPNVKLRTDFINDLLSNQIDGYQYKISDKCINTIDDYENVKEDRNGGKLKTEVKDPITKKMYQQYGHLTDTDDYFLCEYFKELYESKYIRLKKGYKKAKSFGK